MPDVTVLMSVFNGEAFVAQAVASVLRQSFRDFEFMIVDDGSTDDTANIVRSFADPRIVFIQNERNLGLTKSLNRGLLRARGALVARQDADDISLPDRVARQKQYLDAHPDVSLVGSAYEEIDESGRAFPSPPLPRDNDEIRWALLFYCPLVHGAVTVRKAALESVGWYNEHYLYAQDYELWTRMARTHRMANLDDVLVQYRVSASSMTATHPAVATEPLRIGLAALRALSGWSCEDAALEERLRDMQRMLKSDARTEPPDDPGRAWRDLLSLHDAFCAREAIDASRRQILRRDLERSVVDNLVRHHAKREASAGRYLRAVMLIARAVQLRATALARGLSSAAATTPDGKRRDC